MNAKYTHYTSEALEFERQSLFRKAAKSWRKAADAARKPENILWCNSRADICDRKHR